MNPVITWIIERLDCLPLLDGNANVVASAAWRVIAMAGIYAAAANGVQIITYSSDTEFTPFDALSQDQVLGWVHDAMGPDGVSSIIADLTVNIAKQVDPGVVSFAFPFLS